MIRSLIEGRAQEATSSDRQLVLRLWNTGIVLDPEGASLWVGNVSLQEPVRILVLTLPVTTREYDLPLERLMQSLNGVEQRVARRPRGGAAGESRWSGRVLLLRND